MLNGVIFESNLPSQSSICIVESLSDQLKELIRDNLSSICHGESSGESGRIVYSYRNTLREFLKRYDSKNENLRKGMIGELLAHVLFIEFFDEFNAVSPLFNLEERNIKKSFDVIMIHTSSNDLYYTEVKSGSVTNGDSNSKNSSLLSAAKSGILEKLSENNDNNWLNAIHGAKIALESRNIKDEVVKILEECLSDSQNVSSDSKTKNVILVSVTYNDVSDKITLARVSSYRSNIGSDDFNNSIIFSIQKHTYQSVEQFFRNEVSGD